MISLPVFIYLFIIINFTSARVLTASVTETGHRIQGAWKPDELFPASYNKLKAPTNGTGPITVKIGLNITSIFRVDEATLSYRIRGVLSQSWVDYRINYPVTEANKRIFLDPYFIDKLWIPQTFISNSVEDTESHSAPLVMYEVNSLKEVSLAARLTAKLTCEFDLSLFPHDTQTCHVILESRKSFLDLLKLLPMTLLQFSDTNTKASVNYTWSHFNLLHTESARFRFSHVDHDYCENSRGPEFSCLRATFQLERRLAYYAIK